MNEEQMITLNLTINEVNAILTSLGQLPYTQVFQLIGKVKDQAVEQLQPPVPSVEE